MEAREGSCSKIRIMGDFTAEVGAERREEWTQGQCFMGARAVAAGLADEMVQDLAAVIEDLEAGS